MPMLRVVKECQGGKEGGVGVGGREEVRLERKGAQPVEGEGRRCVLEIPERKNEYGKSPAKPA